MSLLEAPRGDWHDADAWMIRDAETRQAAERDRGHRRWAAARPCRDWTPLPDLVDCAVCTHPFRPGARWLEAHGDRCADCAGDALFVV